MTCDIPHLQCLSHCILLVGNRELYTLSEKAFIGSFERTAYRGKKKGFSILFYSSPSRVAGALELTGPQDTTTDVVAISQNKNIVTWKVESSWGFTTWLYSFHNRSLQSFINEEARPGTFMKRDLWPSHLFQAAEPEDYACVTVPDWTDADSKCEGGRCCGWKWGVGVVVHWVGMQGRRMESYRLGRKTLNMMNDIQIKELLEALKKSKRNARRVCLLGMLIKPNIFVIILRRVLRVELQRMWF